jgi:hypothetical protein
VLWTVQPTREQAQESPFAGVYSPPPTPTTTITPTPTIYEVFSEQNGVNILDQILATRGASESSGLHPPSGSGPSESSGALPGGGSRLLSVASESSGPATPHGMIYVSTGSSRPLKHDRHGTPVPERAVPAATAHSHPGSVASVSTGRGPGGTNPVDSVSIAPWFKGGAPADFPISGVTAEPPPIWPSCGVTAELSANPGSNGGAPAKCSTDGFQPLAASAQGPSSNDPWKGANSDSALPMEVESWVEIGHSESSGANFPNIVVSQTNILNEACVFGNINAQQGFNDTRIAVETAINVAEERHSR